MVSSSDINRSQALTSETQRLAAAFESLDTDAKLIWLYLVYEKMGESITPAAPAATDPELAPKLLKDYYQLSNDDQLAIMRQIVNRENTEYSHDYGILEERNQLMVWLAWAQAMGDTVVDIPESYKQNEAINNLLSQIEGIDFDAQITVLRAIASNMGYTDVKPIETQDQTGKTSSL